MNQNDFSLLQCQSLACQRGNQTLLSGLSFNLCSGQLFQIVGNNGAGKTSLLRTLAGLMPKAAGSIKAHGKLCYLAHDNAVKKELTVFENVRWDIGLCGASISKIDSALKYFDLISQRNTMLAKLSQGQRRRLALVKLFLSDARLYILDEPLAALDGQAQLKFKQLIDKKRKEQSAVIITSHQPLIGFEVTKTISL